ncbi:hypothetical protein [Lapidilactobacillus salsurivasis]
MELEKLEIDYSKKLGFPQVTIPTNYARRPSASPMPSLSYLEVKLANQARLNSYLIRKKSDYLL